MSQTPEQISVRKLLYASAAAAAAAILILLTAVLPAEFGIDPTGIGEALGLKRVGELKQAHAPTASPSALPIPPAATEPAVTEVEPTAAPVSAIQHNEFDITLQPGEGVEYKATMRVGQSMHYRWTTDQGELYFDFHGDAENAKNGEFTSYKEATDSSDSGDFTASFNGIHGWYWKNRTGKVIQVHLQTEGNYLSIDRIH
ncbi:hypothetical protein HPT27_14635 [Permianibacter sp. IMCC34836]|uniref:hypothetical protein n=1 Tax=Permianibacter fluminis TaxID=2738515 RepID=UPI001555F3B6|nr:hypothetical protein [Permianibacter fluminis]NQD38261.1 hypothetical protein [Permianibacter fluminis]